MAPRGSNALGARTDPYRYVVHTGPLVLLGTPRAAVHHCTAVHTTSGMHGGEERAPGLNGPVSFRANGTQRFITGLLFWYLRQF